MEQAGNLLDRRLAIGSWTGGKTIMEGPWRVPRCAARARCVCGLPIRNTADCQSAARPNSRAMGRGSHWPATTRQGENITKPRTDPFQN